MRRACIKLPPHWNSRSGRLGRVRTELLRALQCDPSDSEAYLNLAMLELGQAQYSHAVPPLKDYIRLKPQDALGHLLLGRAYLNRNLN